MAITNPAHLQTQHKQPNHCCSHQFCTAVTEPIPRAQTSPLPSCVEPVPLIRVGSVPADTSAITPVAALHRRSH
ncbi:hypothetical protein M0R45_030440 [Rubus argutus]|uniref:Uncharacterized protein n=1 Tax=Rubus argutus TaxID=59490 RepID=A0AAW1WD03_RUBAR